jgi:hypothetical protein
MPFDESIPADDFESDLKPLEAALGSLMPTASRIDRDRLMFLAGAASIDATASAETGENISAAKAGDDCARLPRHWQHRFFAAFWPLATAVLLLISIGLGALLAFRQPGERVVYVERQPTQDSQLPRSIASFGAPPVTAFTDRTIASASADASYLVLRQQVLRRGVAALDSTSQSDQRPKASEARNRALLNELLGG